MNEKIDKEEAKKRMEVSMWEYVSEREVLEALLFQDTEKLDKIRSLDTRLTIINSSMKTEIDLADSNTFNSLVGTYKKPAESLK